MSGAKNCPETPRQKMIGMMYLVLTAMLALNVSASILEGFSMVDNSLHTTIESANIRNQAQYRSFTDLYNQNPKKVKQWLDQAILVRKKSDELYNYIQDFKVAIIKLADSDDANDSAYVKQIKAKDNTDKAAEYAIVGNHGADLKRKIDEYANFLVGLSQGNPEKMNMYKSIFSTNSFRQSDGSKKPWVDAIFADVPVAAVVTILTKYQSDVRATEAEIVQYLKAQTDAGDFRVNDIKAYVIPESKYVIRGDRYKAQIVLSAVDSTKKPTYYVNGSIVSGGKYEVGCNAVGQKTFSGMVTIPGNDGNPKTYKFNDVYNVGEPSATLSNEDLNVLYKGWDNKINVSVPGVAASNISIQAEGANVVQKAPGRYVVRPSRDGEVKISVFAMIDKKRLAMGGGVYRVKMLPDPKTFIQTADGKQQKSGCILSPSLLKSSQIVASYGNDELIKANFTVVSFSVVVPGIGSQTVNGTRISSTLIDKLRKGDVMMLNNVKAVGPDQNVRDLGSFNIQL